MTENRRPKGLPRPVEALLAATGLIVLTPVLAAAALFVKLTSKGGVLFCQRRVGLGGREFTLYKFRTMRAASDGLKVTSANDNRITGVGRVLRKTKIDELPGLWNVLRGEMSFVGPRPEVPDYVDLENPLWRKILTVRPGITDPVTLRLRNEEQLLASVEDKQSFYVETLQPFKLRGYARFVETKSWQTDLKVIFQTLKAVALPKTAPPPTVEELQLAFTD